MGRATERKVMKTKKTSSPVGEGELKPLDEGMDDDKEQLRIVNLVCDAVDHEAESRSATIMAIGDGYMASATTHLQLMMSRLPEHIRKMPMKKFLKQHCPNTKASTRSDGTLCFDLVQDPAFQPPSGGGILDVSTGFSAVQNTPGFEPSQIRLEGFYDTRNYTPMTEEMRPSQTGMALAGGTERKVTTRGLRV